MRVLGPQLAEMPFVATRAAARRQGHARVLLRASEAFLVQVHGHCFPSLVPCTVLGYASLLPPFLLVLLCCYWLDLLLCCPHVLWVVMLFWQTH